MQNEGRTALQLAQQEGQEPVVEALRDGGAEGSEEPGLEDGADSEESC